MKSLAKRLIAGVLLSVMAVCGSSALAAEKYDDPVPYNDFVGDTVYWSDMPIDWDLKCDTTKDRVKGVKVGWLDISSGYGTHAPSGVFHAKWKAVPGAKSYEIVISRTRNNKTINKYFRPCEWMFSDTNSCSLSAEASYVFHPKEHKTYYVRVRALYENGDPGPWSKTVKFRTTKKYKL